MGSSLKIGVAVICRNWKVLTSSFFVVIVGAILFNSNIVFLGGSLNTTTKVSVAAYSCIIPLLLSFFRIKDYHLDKRERILTVLLAVLFSQFICMGSYADTVTFASLCFRSLPSFLMWGLQTLIYSYCAYYFIGHAVFELQNYHFQHEKVQYDLRKVFIVLLLVNLLFIAVFFPCIFDFDGALGLRTFLDPNEVKSNHHPYFVQMVHGLFWKLGNLMGSPALGFAILTLFFSSLSAAVITYGLSVIRHYGYKRELLLLLLLLPIYLFIAHLPTKDGFFAIAFLSYNISIFNIINTNQECLKSVRFLFVHFLCILIVCLSRNQGVYIVLIESAVLLFVCRKFFLRLFLSIIPALVFVLLFTNVYLPSRNVVPSSKAEIFGSLFQQTALCAIRHTDDITADEMEAINAILPIESIKDNYNPAITDDVKGCYCMLGWSGVTVVSPQDVSDGMLHFVDKTIADENTKIKQYLSSWFSMFIRHPITYFDATFAVIYGFFYNSGQSLCILSTDWPSSKATIPQYAFKQNVRVQQSINSVFGYAAHMPIVNWIMSIPYYIWLLILLLSIVLMRRDWKGVLLIGPCILSLGVLLVCPVCNARYMYPILLCIPLYMLYVIATNKTNISNE